MCVCQRWFLVQGQIKSIGAAAVTHIKDDSSSTALVVASKAPAKEAPPVRNSAPYAIRSLLISAETCRAWMLSGFLLLDGRCSARSTRSRKRGRDSESSTGAPAAKAAKTKKQSAAAAAKAKAKAEEEAAAAQAGVRAAFPSSPCHCRACQR